MYYDWEDKPELNITPLVDVMLVLLAILMVIAPNIIYEENIKLPHGSTSSQLSKIPPVHISIDKDSTNVDLGVGYRFRDMMFSTLSYQRAIFNEVNIDNLYVSLNYQFREIHLKPYVGVLIGLSRLVWSKYPVSGTLDNDNESITLLGGLQLGVEYSFSDDWSIFGEYQILKNEHKTNILGDNLKIAFQNNLNVGVSYKF